MDTSILMSTRCPVAVCICLVGNAISRSQLQLDGWRADFLSRISIVVTIQRDESIYNHILRNILIEVSFHLYLIHLDLIYSFITFIHLIFQIFNIFSEWSDNRWGRSPSGEGGDRDDERIVEQVDGDGETCTGPRNE